MNKKYKEYLDTLTHIKPQTLFLLSKVFKGFPSPSRLNGDYFRVRVTGGTYHGKEYAKLSPTTLKMRVSYAKAFLLWADMDASSLDKKNLRLVRPTETVTVEDLYSREDLQLILSNLNTTRDRAMIEVLYESGCRARELLSMTLENIKSHPSQPTASIIVKGKTGTREIPIYESVPALNAWVNVHPTKEGPVWVTERGKIGPLKYQALYKIVRLAFARAGLTEKKRILHMFRHTRATDLVRRGVRGQALNKIMGWSAKSNMEAVYVHLSTHDVNNEMFSKVFGLEEREDEKPEVLKSGKCISCGTKNPQGSYVCTKCNAPLTEDKIREALSRSQDNQELKEKVERLEKLVALLYESIPEELKED